MAKRKHSNEKNDDSKHYRKNGLLPKSFHDPIHGHIELNPFLVKVIDTPQFQRLRKIKQLSLGYYVYPGACHNRFEHSLGTCHLAGKLVRHLREDLPKGVKITDKDVFCVELAGLCHDLGHGPFSHLFDGEFLKQPSINKDWNHEDGSLKMLDRLFEENNLFKQFKENGFKSKYKEEFEEKDLKFVKKMIKPSEAIHMKDKHKFFYEIISNKETEVDVDKWDYFARDSHYLGIKSSFDHNRFLALTKVLINKNGKTCIGVRDKEIINLYEMFDTRKALYKRAYMHKTVVGVNAMVRDALVYANDSVFYYLPKNANDPTKKYRISDTVKHMPEFELLNDSVLDRIETSESIDESGKLAKSKELLKRLSERKLYRYIGNLLIQGEKQKKNATLKEREDDNWKTKKKAEDAKNEIMEKIEDSNEDLLVEIVKFDYGMKNSNPVDYFNFYTKENPNIAMPISKEEVSHMLPEVFLEYQLFVYCKSVDEEVVKNMRENYDEWKKAQEEGKNAKQ